ncbi:hypothetical protein EXIGLDRAFT_839267 [Exidia glandulosa HHB12029]|uniref:Potassium transport protein n=1 Tax=Exidia glandulosa HHB12029 TaxID=1314781 RepID=A0A165F4Y8_EXIGL|nr:hypothetical protein EXIGLDRAFT_839267 [Exidia glandulosa HHB12029]
MDSDNHTNTGASTASRAKSWLSAFRHLNFYRIHLLVFTFTPLIFSVLFYAANGRFHISYVDGLFLCVTSMTVTGLSTVDLSQLTAVQQAMMFVQTCLGSLVGVSWLMVYIRRYFFKKKFEHIIEAEIQRQSESTTPTSGLSAVPTIQSRIAQIVLMRSLKKQKGRKSKLSTLSEHTEPRSTLDDAENGKSKLRIRRVDEAPRLINPQGWISDDPPPELKEGDPSHTAKFQEEEPAVTESPKPINIELTPETPEDTGPEEDERDARSEQSDVRSDNEFPLRRRFGPDVDVQLRSFGTTTSVRREPIFPRTQTVEFAPHPLRHAHHVHARHDSMQMSQRGSIARESAPSHSHASNFPRARTYESRPGTMPRSASLARVPSVQPARDIGFGGFPYPTELIPRLFRRMFPKLQQRLKRTLTVPRTTTVMSTRSATSAARPALERQATRTAPYLSFDAVVGRNSAFDVLTTEQLEELGGVEYRALNMLLWVIGLYHIGSQLIAVLVIAPYISQARWKNVFLPPMQHRPVPPVWFTVFQVASAYTNAGTSLVDQSMIPFQTAYPMIIFMGFLILAGNTAFPIFLRLIIWIMYKVKRKNTKASETLCFLLDHPRRCFIYLFPSHQTWFLLTVLIILNGTDWFFFLVLDIGNPEIEQVPLGTRFVIGLLQAFAVRAAGFATIGISALAPAVKVLYVTMMYISVYPIALSVRTTNVYEEQSLGIFEAEDSSEEEPGVDRDGSRGEVWGRYLAWHARKQLAFDMWWLGVALFLICIVERSQIQNPNNEAWFNIFSIVFELVSAYGTVGLSLGTPNANYSFSGELKPLSKLIICAVMIRGRHRGLPVAIDRAVLLPSEFKKQEPQPLDDEPYVDVGDESVMGDGQRTSQTGHGNGVDTRRRSSSVPGAHRKATV